MENENPGDAALLRSVHGKLVVVVRGSMDHIEEVLRAARIEPITARVIEAGWQRAKALESRTKAQTGETA